MPRVHRQKAGKDYPNWGIEKGQIYYSWTFRYGGKIRSLKYPRPSQLTRAKYAIILAACEEAQDVANKYPADHSALASWRDDVAGAVQSIIDAATDCRDEYQEAVDAFEHGNSQHEERVDACESFIDEAESVLSEIESREPEEQEPDEDAEEGDDPPFDEDFVSAIQDLVNELEYEGC